MRISDVSSDVCSSDLATSGDITSLDTRVTTPETDITARPTSAQLAAPEGAAGIGYANSDVKDKLAGNRSLLAYLLAIDLDYTNDISWAEVAGIRATFLPTPTRVVEGKYVAVRVDPGGHPKIPKKNHTNT